MLPPHFTLLQVIPELEAGGAEQSTLEIAEAVVRAGGRALVASRGGRLESRLLTAGGELIPMRVDTKNPVQGLINAFALADLCRNRRVSLMHVRSRAPALSVRLAARLAKTPWLATYHGAYPARSALKRWYNAGMTRGVAVIANSEFTRRHVEAIHPEAAGRIVTIARGVDPARFDPDKVSPERIVRARDFLELKEPDGPPVVLCPGRLTRIKGQGVLIAAAATLAREGREDFLLRFVGDDQGRSAYREELLEAIRGAGLSDRTRVLGHAQDMPAVLAVSDLVATPSTVPETFGRVAVEAQAMRRPVIASDLGAQSETVRHGETGWLVPPGDPQAWAAALVLALDAGKALRGQMGEAGRRRALRHYTVAAMTEATLALYAEVLEAA